MNAMDVYSFCAVDEYTAEDEPTLRLLAFSF